MSAAAPAPPPGSSRRPHCQVLGVEPDARMALPARSRGLEVELATFEAWDPAGRTFDAVVAGTAWHWVDPVAGAAKAAQVLRPGGRLAPFHHVFQPPPEVLEALAKVYRQVAPDSPVNLSGQLTRSAMDAYQPLFAKIADGILEVGGFSEPEQWQFEWERTYTRDEWLDQLPTSGTLTQLPPDKLAQILDAVGAAIDGLGGSFTVPYTTAVVRRGAPRAWASDRERLSQGTAGRVGGGQSAVRDSAGWGPVSEPRPARSAARSRTGRPPRRDGPGRVRVLDPQR